MQKLVLIDSAGLTESAKISKFIFPPFDYLAAEFLRQPQIRDRISRAAYKNQSLASSDALLCGA